ncbi:hypothetical protein FB468_0637 [Leucobacter komagatae]|uniref:Uncharacterized protein n=1 Tax=Leucobacter komagatae TaxID=55969 RepID=A0A542Y3I2_9MICO|nr:hypothetical protein [Leucobacter komagatae]TQL42634.1 hypothetical protein FB468_0637 [Leucobacter komagatae]
MALREITFFAPASDVTFMGGGEGRPVTDFDSGTPVLRNGRPLRRFAGVTAMYKGTVLENLTVESTTEATDLGSGGLLAAQGQTVEITPRGDAKAGFNGGAPRASLAGKVFTEGFTPVGSISDLLAQAARRTGKAE